MTRLSLRGSANCASLGNTPRYYKIGALLSQGTMKIGTLSIALPDILHNSSIFRQYILSTSRKMAPESNKDIDTTGITQNSGGQTEVPPQFKVVKQYKPRGGWTLHRLASATAFTCGRCNKQKTAKLVAVHDNRWDTIRCNGCYGEVLSKE